MATKTKTQKELARQNRIRIKLKSFDSHSLDKATDQIVEAVKRTGANVCGPIPLPTHIRRYCVLRSPHVDKKSREHFQIDVHSRLVDILDPTQETTEALTRMDLAAGVDIAIKV